MGNMGGVLGSLAEEGVDEYMLSTGDDVWNDVVRFQEGFIPPKTYRLRPDAICLGSEPGTAASRVACALVQHAFESRGLEASLNPSQATCIGEGLIEAIEQCHHGGVTALRVEKEEESVKMCLASGYPVTVAIPCTCDVLEREVKRPQNDDEFFAYVPVVLWGYSSVSKRFAAHVPLSMYDKPVALPFDHVFSPDACDLYIVDVKELDEAPVAQGAEEPLFL